MMIPHQLQGLLGTLRYSNNHPSWYSLYNEMTQLPPSGTTSNPSTELISTGHTGDGGHPAETPSELQTAAKLPALHVGLPCSPVRHGQSLTLIICIDMHTHSSHDSNQTMCLLLDSLSGCCYLLLTAAADQQYNPANNRPCPPATACMLCYCFVSPLVSRNSE
jgi:hypothetical protein